MTPRKDDNLNSYEQQLAEQAQLIQNLSQLYEAEKALRVQLGNRCRELERALQRHGIDVDEEARPALPVIPPADFPLYLLPGPVRNYVRAAAKALPAAPAMVAVPALIALSGAIGSRAQLQIKASWLEPAILWAVIVSPSGTVKTPALRLALRPIYHRERLAHEQYEWEMERWDPASGAPEPVRRRYRTGDATTEAIALLLADNPGGVILVRDELAAWLGSFDRYAKGASDLQFWIEAHTGLPASVDRKSTGNITVDRPAVSVTGTIQPGTLKEKLGDVHFDTGFAARLLLVMPPATPKTWTDADVTEAVDEAYRRLIDDLYATPMGTVLTLTPEAKQVFKAFVNANGAEVYAMEDGPAKAVASKTEMHAARLALILHLARLAAKETASVEVDAASMQMAILLARWLRDETFRVYETLDLVANAMPPKRRFLNHLPPEFETAEAHALKDEFGISRRTVHRWLDKLIERGNLVRLKEGAYRRLDARR